jgi:hypothetical protein
MRACMVPVTEFRMNVFPDARMAVVANGSCKGNFFL